MRIAFLLITLLISIPIYPFCSCVELNSLDREEYNNYDLIVRGAVASIDVTEDPLKTITLEVKETYKGEMSEKRVKISTPRRLSYCGLNIGVDDEWIIYAYEKNGIFQTNICTRSTPVPPRDFRGERLEEDLKFLKEIKDKNKAALQILNDNRKHFKNIVPGKHETFDTYGYVDSLQFGLVSNNRTLGIKLFSTVFSEKENMDYIEVQELLFQEIRKVQQKGNHLDLISKAEGENGNCQIKVSLCMDYHNMENLEKVVSSIKEMCCCNFRE